MSPPRSRLPRSGFHNAAAGVFGELPFECAPRGYVPIEYGAMLSGMGKPAEALKEYREGVAIGEALLPAQPNDLALRRDLADCYASIGRYYEKQDPLQAREWYQKDLATWTEWPRYAVSGRFDQARRERAMANLAGCAAAQAPKNRWPQ